MADSPHPAPILFHPLKHHLTWIKECVLADVSLQQNTLSQLKKQLLTIGESQMDLYVGKLSVQEVAERIRVFLHASNKLDQKEYTHWLNQTDGYRPVSLSDGSVWILREGHEPDRYVHIHPARHSLHTLRVKAGSLKTAIASIVWGSVNESEAKTLLTINQARTEWLHYAPIKSLKQANDIERMITLLTGTNP
jgi:hypothetical protein